MSLKNRNPIFMLACLVALTACAPLPPQGVTRTGLSDVPVETLSTEPLAYRLATNDEVEVRLGERIDLIQTVKVQPDGMISLHDLPNVMAAGRTVEQLQTALRLAVTALTQPATDGSNASMRPVYLMNVGDELELRFTYYPALNQLVRIRPDGQISLPYIKTVNAEGLSPEQLETDLQKRYRDYLKKPDLTLVVRSFSSYRVQLGNSMLTAGVRANTVTVALRSFATPQIFISGEVARPGVLNFRPGMTLLQAIVEAGGQRATAEMGSVIVLRRAADGEGLMIRRNLADHQSQGLVNDLALAPSDIVLLPKTHVANVAEAVDQYLYQIIAPLRNSSFGFVYNLRQSSTVEVK